MALYENGPTTQYNASNAGVIPTDVFGVAINWFVNRTPLTARLPKSPVGSPDFKITNDDYRPRTDLVKNTTSIAQSGTTLTVVDGSKFDVGDVVQIEDEYLLVTAISGNNLTVTRGYAGSSDVAHTADKEVLLITNTRTGAEVDINAISRIPQVVTQHCQTVQHAYSVGGALQANSNYVSGHGTPLQRDKFLAVQHVMDDFESAIYYGAGVALAATTTRPAMKGLRTLITTNKTTSPTNAANYQPTDLFRDTVQKCFDGGGNPNLLVVSTNFLTGLATWGQTAMRIPAGANVFGTPIELFEVPFLSGIRVVPSPLLRQGTAICLSLPEVRVRLKRPMFDQERGKRGDATEGDIIMEGAIELDNEKHHAWVQGISGFEAT